LHGIDAVGAAAPLVRDPLDEERARPVAARARIRARLADGQNDLAPGLSRDAEATNGDGVGDATRLGVVRVDYPMRSAPSSSHSAPSPRRLG
jgi:hypothetical protein